MPTLSVFRAFCQAFHTIKDNPVLVLRLMIPVIVVQTLSFALGIQPMTWLDVTITAIGLWLAGALSVNIITLAVAGTDALPNPERAAWIPGVLAFKVLAVQLALFLFSWLAIMGMLIGVIMITEYIPWTIVMLSDEWLAVRTHLAVPISASRYVTETVGNLIVGILISYTGFLMFRTRLRLIFAPVTMTLRLSAPLDTSRHAAHGIIGKLFLLLCLAGLLQYLPSLVIVEQYIVVMPKLRDTWSIADAIRHLIIFNKVFVFRTLHVYSLQFLALVLWFFTLMAIACAFRQVRDRNAQAAS